MFANLADPITTEGTRPMPTIRFEPLPREYGEWALPTSGRVRVDELSWPSSRGYAVTGEPAALRALAGQLDALARHLLEAAMSGPGDGANLRVRARWHQRQAVRLRAVLDRAA